MKINAIVNDFETVNGHTAKARKIVTLVDKAENAWLYGYIEDPHILVYVTIDGVFLGVIE